MSIRTYIPPIELCSVSLYFRHSVPLYSCCSILSPLYFSNTPRHRFSIQPALLSCVLLFFSRFVSFSFRSITAVSFQPSVFRLLLPSFFSSFLCYCTSPFFHPQTHLHSIFPCICLSFLPSRPPIVPPSHHIFFSPSHCTINFLPSKPKLRLLYCLNNLLYSCIVAKSHYDIVTIP